MGKIVRSNHISTSVVSSPGACLSLTSRPQYGPGVHCTILCLNSICYFCEHKLCIARCFPPDLVASLRSHINSSISCPISTRLSLVLLGLVTAPAKSCCPAKHIRRRTRATFSVAGQRVPHPAILGMDMRSFAAGCS